MTAEWPSAGSKLTEHLDQARRELEAGLTVTAQCLADRASALPVTGSATRPVVDLGEVAGEQLREVVLARRAIHRLTGYLTVAAQACDDIAAAVSDSADASGEPIAIGAAAQPWHDVVLLRRLCGLADEVGADAARKIDAATLTLDVARGRGVAHEMIDDVAEARSLRVHLVCDRVGVDEARIHAQAAGRLAESLVRDLGSAPGHLCERGPHELRCGVGNRSPS